LGIARIETIADAPDTIESIVCRRHQTANNPTACHRVHQGAALNLLILILIVHKIQLFVFDTFDTGVQIQNSTDFKKNTPPNIAFCHFWIGLWIVPGKPITFLAVRFLYISCLYRIIESVRKI
jgi:hypothetical protein